MIEASFLKNHPSIKIVDITESGEDFLTQSLGQHERVSIGDENYDSLLIRVNYRRLTSEGMQLTLSRLLGKLHLLDPNFRDLAQKYLLKVAEYQELLTSAEFSQAQIDAIITHEGQHGITNDVRADQITTNLNARFRWKEVEQELISGYARKLLKYRALDEATATLWGLLAMKSEFRPALVLLTFNHILGLLIPNQDNQTPLEQIVGFAMGENNQLAIESNADYHLAYLMFATKNKNILLDIQQGKIKLSELRSLIEQSVYELIDSPSSFLAKLSNSTFLLNSEIEMRRLISDLEFRTE